MFLISKFKPIIRVLTIVIFVFFAFSFKVTDDSNFIICEIVFICYSFLILFILQSDFFKYIFEPPIFFLIFSFIYEFLKFPYYFQFDSPMNLVNPDITSSKYTLLDYYGNSAFMLVYQIVCILILLLT